MLTQRPGRPARIESRCGFSIASAVALRAYDVPRSEQFRILKFLIRELIESPWSSLLPAREGRLSVIPDREQTVEEEVRENGTQG